MLYPYRYCNTPHPVDLQEKGWKAVEVQRSCQLVPDRRGTAFVWRTCRRGPHLRCGLLMRSSWDKKNLPSLHLNKGKFSCLLTVKFDFLPVSQIKIYIDSYTKAPNHRQWSTFQEQDLLRLE